MKTALSMGLALAVSVLAALEAQAAEPSIAFVDQARAGAWSVWVMDADGSDRTEIFRTPKQYETNGRGLRPAISPDGEVVAVHHVPELFDRSILAIPTAGGTPEVMLCAEEINGAFLSVHSLEWSPGGAELAVHVTNYPPGGAYEDLLLFLPSGGVPSCPFELAEIDYVHLPATAHAGVTWNHDGSQLAFLEADFDLEQDWLVIIDRTYGTEVDRYPIVWPPGESPWEPDQTWGPDSLVWQRAADSLSFSFSSYQEPGFREDPVETLWLLDVPDGGWAVAIPLNEDGGSPTWSPDDSQILFSRAGSLTRLTLATGTTGDLGPGYEPDWKRDPLPQSCSSNADCDDSNPCTDNVCNSGICETLNNTALCDDGDVCTDPDLCIDGQCVGTPAPNCCIPTHSKEKGPRCGDALDNDCDGLIDGDDPDCQ